MGATWVKMRFTQVLGAVAYKIVNLTTEVVTEAQPNTVITIAELEPESK